MQLKLLEAVWIEIFKGIPFPGSRIGLIDCLIIIPVAQTGSRVDADEAPGFFEVPTYAIPLAHTGADEATP